MHKVLYEKRAQKDLQKIPSQDLRKIKQKIDDLAKKPRPKACTKLKGFQNVYRVRSGHYRIIYQVIDKQVIVIVVAVKHRKSVYRNL